MLRLVTIFSSIVITITLVCSAWAEPTRLSEPVATDQNSETFGKLIDDSKQTIDLTTLIERPKHYLGKQVLVETSIAKVCQKKGCFFIAQQDHHTLRVAFKDYGFFIPTDSGGKNVLLSGELVEKEMTTEQAAHFTADLNSTSVALNAGKVYEIVASGIRIPVN